MSDLSPHSIPLPERGWTRERMAQFLDYLSEKGNVAAACKRVGLSREAAYRQRRRNEAFARGWAAAMVLALDANEQVLADRAIDGIEEEVWNRGEMVGTKRRYDTRLLLAHLARLDKAAENPAAQRDAGRFDELLAVIAGEPMFEGIRDPEDILPLNREQTATAAGADAEDGVRFATNENGEEALREPEPEDHECHAAYAHGYREGQRIWDTWHGNACDYVDWLSGWDDGVRVQPMSRGEDDGYAPADFDPRTVSDVSTGSDAAGSQERSEVGEPPSTPASSC